MPLDQSLSDNALKLIVWGSYRHIGGFVIVLKLFLVLFEAGAVLSAHIDQATQILQFVAENITRNLFINGTNARFTESIFPSFIYVLFLCQHAGDIIFGVECLGGMCLSFGNFFLHLWRIGWGLNLAYFFKSSLSSLLILLLLHVGFQISCGVVCIRYLTHRLRLILS